MCAGDCVSLRIRYLIFLIGMALISARAEVRVSLAETNQVLWVRYECTAGELVRAFALDVSVDAGEITGISNYFRGESRTGATGYGIFPASLRAQLLSTGTTNIDWDASEYSPLASTNDDPEDTLPGLNSPGVTLEFGGLWDPSVLAALPSAAGTLCTLNLSQPANAFIAANLSRGGVVSAFTDGTIEPVFESTLPGPSITAATLQDGAMTILFNGGELESAPRVDGPWTGTGDSSGSYTEPIGTNTMRFYRVRGTGSEP